MYVYVRYVGVHWFISHVLRLLLIEFTQQNVCLQQQIYDETYAKTRLKIRPPHIQLRHQKCMFVGFLSAYIRPVNCVDY